jgi:hypothetical protein
MMKLLNVMLKLGPCPRSAQKMEGERERERDVEVMGVLLCFTWEVSLFKLKLTWLKVSVIIAVLATDPAKHNVVLQLYPLSVN